MTLMNIFYAGSACFAAYVFYNLIATQVDLIETVKVLSERVDELEGHIGFEECESTSSPSTDI